MNDFQNILQGLKESTDFIAMEEKNRVERIETNTQNLEDEVDEFKSIEVEEIISNDNSTLTQKLDNIQESLDNLDKKIDSYNKLNKNVIEEVYPYSDITKFISMLEHYYYSFIVDKSLSFENPLFDVYKNNLIIISQNILANSFKFFEKNDILDSTIILGEQIKTGSTLVQERVDELEFLLKSMRDALIEIEYKKGYFFAKILNDRGLILNSITIISEILGEYIVESSRKLSPYSKERIDTHLDNIDISKSTRRAYSNFYKRAKEFFRSHFSKIDNPQPITFFAFRDYGNKEIEKEMKKIFNSNKMNKSNLFVSYSHLIEDVRLIRNDLAHGNNSGVYGNIKSNMNEILIDFKYLAIDKNFLQI
jgi:hypothetical protein